MVSSNHHSEAARVSIVIATRDRRAYLRRCLEALGRLNPRPGEVVVIDDGPPDPSWIVALCNKLQLPVVYKAKTPPGTCGSRNLGVRLAKGDFVLFIDDDVLLEEDYIERILEVFERDASIGGVGGSLEDNLPKSRPGVRVIFQFLRMLFLLQSPIAGRVLPSGFRTHARRVKRERSVQILSTSNSCYRREVFDRVRFDETYDKLSGGYAYGEDADFSYRVSRNWRLRITPDARGFHEYAPPHFLSRDRLEKIYIIHHYLFLKNAIGLSPLRMLAFSWALLGVSVCDLLAFALRPTATNRELMAAHLAGIRIIAAGRATRPFADSEPIVASPGME